MAIAGYVRGMEYQHTLVVTIDGVKVFQNTIGGEEDIKAIDQQQAPAVAAINSRFHGHPGEGDGGTAQGCGGRSLRGRTRNPTMCCTRSGRAPVRIASRKSTAWRSRVRSIRPASARRRAGRASSCAGQRRQSDELPCAKTILSSLARKAYPSSDHRGRSRGAARLLRRGAGARRFRHGDS